METISEGSVMLASQAPLFKNIGSEYDSVLEVRDTRRWNSSECVVVNVCGRCISTPAELVPSFSAMQSFLQKELTLEGQQFNLCNDCGDIILTDDDLRAAAVSGTPLCATLSEASVHCIETRKQELTHLQWKLMRDQVASVAEKLTMIAHRVQEMSEAFENVKHEQQATALRLRSEMESLSESTKELGRQDLTQLLERIDGVSQNISAERNRRELTKQSMEQQIQQLRDMLSGDRSTRRSENAGLQSSIDDMRQAVLEESRCREVLEARHSSDVNWLSERIELLARGQAEKVQDLCDQVKCVAMNVNQSLQDTARSVLQVQSIAETTQIEANSRLKAVEDRFPGIEGKISEIANREVMHYDELQAKQQKLYSVTEQLRLEERGRGLASSQLEEVEVARDHRQQVGGNATNGVGTGSFSLPQSPEVEGPDVVPRRPPSPTRMSSEVPSTASAVNGTVTQRTRSVSPPAPLSRTALSAAPQAVPATASALPSSGAIAYSGSVSSAAQGFSSQGVGGIMDTVLSPSSASAHAWQRNLPSSPEVVRTAQRSLSPVPSRARTLLSSAAAVGQGCSPTVSGWAGLQRGYSVPRLKPEGSSPATVRWA